MRVILANTIMLNNLLITSDCKSDSMVRILDITYVFMRAYISNYSCFEYMCQPMR